MVKSTIDFLKPRIGVMIAFAILALLALGLLWIQFRYPLALNMDGGNNAANTLAIMNGQSMPFSGSPILPFALSALFGFIAGSVHAGIKIVTTISLVAVGYLIYAFTKHISKEDVAPIAALLGWCVSLGVFSYPLGYLKQTVSLPFLVAGLMSLYLVFESDKPKKYLALWAVCLVCAFMSHTPAVFLYLASSYTIAAIMLPGSDFKHGKLASALMWAAFGLGVMFAPWLIPFLSRWFVQLSLDGVRTIIVAIKGLFAFRVSEQVDFQYFDYLHIAVAVYGLAFTAKEWKRYALWLIGFGIGVVTVSVFASAYEWQGRNILTLFVPLSICVGLGFYHLSRLISKKLYIYVPVAIVSALLVFYVSGYHETVYKTIKLARPVVTVEQLADLNWLLESSPDEITDNLYARHGLRFWATYANGKHCGVLHRHWTENFLAIRSSRGEEELPDSRLPEKGDYLLISRTAMFKWPERVIEGRNYKAYVPEKAEENLRIRFDSTDSFETITVKLESSSGDVITKEFERITYGENILDWLLVGVERGNYNVSIVCNGVESESVNVDMIDNNFHWTDLEFEEIASSKEYVILERRE